jgi:hypothetical protein
LTGENREQEIAEAEPFHLTFYGDEIHGITNLSSEPLLFEVICAPKHVEGEEIVVV